MELAVQRKDDEGQEEELSEELKRFMIQEIITLDFQKKQLKN